MNKTTHNLTKASALSLILSLLVACSNDEEKNLSQETKEIYQDTKTATVQAVDTATDTASEAWQSFANFSIDKRDQAVAFLNEQAENLDVQIDELKDSTADVTDASKQKFNQAIDALEVKREQLAEQIEKAKNATEDNWEDVKQETKNHWNNFVEYLEETKSEFQS